MFTKRMAPLAALIAGGMILAACGSSSDPLDTADDAGTSAEQTADAPTDDADADGATDSPTDDAPTETDDGAAEEPAGPIVIGSANFIESELIAEIYAAALQAQGLDASTHLDIGSREVYLQAIEDGSISIFPEYIGGVLAYYDPDSDATAADDVFNDARAALPDSLQLLQYSPAANQDSVTVTRETAEKYDLKTIGDLAPYSKEMSYGASPEMQTRADGPEGMKRLYDVEFKEFVVLDPGGPLSVKGLTSGLVQVADIFTTDPAIVDNDFVVLEDPLNLFQAQNIAPLVRADVAVPSVVETLDKVSAALTTESLTEMQKTINDTKADPADIAQQWAQENGFA